MSGGRCWSFLSLVGATVAAFLLLAPAAGATGSTLPYLDVTVSPSPAAAGSPVTVKVVAVDASGHTMTSFNGSGTWSDLSGSLTPAAPADFINGISTTTAQVANPYRSDTITVSAGGLSGTSRTFYVYGPVDHLVISNPGTRAEGASFTVTATAQDALNQTVADYNAGATWADLSGSLAPASPASFTKGVSKTSGADVAADYHADTITLASGGQTVTTRPFNVLGAPDRIAVAAPARVYAPTRFTVTATMEDSAGNTLTSYNDPATWFDESGSLNPSAPAAFLHGVSKTTTASITTAVNPDQITVDSGGVSGASSPFDMPVITPSAENGQRGGAISFTGSGWTPNTTLWMGAHDNTSNTDIKFCSLAVDGAGNVATTQCTVSASLSPADNYQLKAYQTNSHSVSWLDSRAFTLGFDWSSPASIDAPRSLTSLSCPTTGLCVATDDWGQVFDTTDPTGGATAWTGTDLIAGDLGAVSCASTTCVTGNNVGEVWVSNDPTAGPTSWSRYESGSLNSITALSCSSPHVCVAGDANGDLAAADPNLGTDAWLVSWNEGHPITGISCPSTYFCVAVSQDGSAIVSTDLTKGNWTPTPFDIDNLTAISCTLDELCVAVDRYGAVWVSRDAADAEPTWTQNFNVDGNILTSVSCPSSSLCVAADNAGNLLTASDPSGVWTTQDVDGTNPISAVSCPTTSLCVAVDADGNVIFGTRPN